VDISIPNKHVVGEIIHNSHANTLAEIAIDIAYSADPEQAAERLKSVLAEFGDDICQDPPPQVGIQAFGESGITLGVRVWLPTERYYDLLYRINLALFNALKEAGIEIPFPQREVRLLNRESI
jgi:small conductance mechanosensitive channel